MAFPQEQLNTGEQVVLDLNPHWWYFAKHVAALAAALIVGGILLSIDALNVLDVVAGFAVLGVLVWIGFRYAKWKTTNFVVTTDRLIYRYGVIAKHGIEIPLDRVNTVIFRQGVFERIIGAGDLVIESAGENGQSNFTDIRKPSAVQTEIYRQIEANENRKFDRVGANLSGGQGGGASIADELAKLDELRAKGVISEEEFIAQKRKLLG